ncbi:hypothetical protein [Stenotrophomonas sp.]|jgi:hypothetical protein|uniref:hypothetical protein n=1 Tax=Stenotrophomonas sp. TaxID=69392 RepID=UPI00289A8594|nr:hypothetical protein [Stenotrophomonas sp.]
MRLSFLLMLLLTLSGPLHTARAGPYVDLVDFPTREANWDRFYALEGRLMHAFDDVCGDTFCEGAYSDYRVLQFRCSVHAGRGHLHSCVWVLAASNLDVDAGSGHIGVDNGRWTCPVPLAPGTTVEAFHAALEGDGLLHGRLPGTDRTLYDGLMACL